MNKLRVQMTNNKADQPRLREEFHTWHRTSTAFYGAAILCGAGAAVVLLPSVAGKARKSKSK